MGLNSKFIVIWKAFSTMRKTSGTPASAVSIETRGLRPFGTPVGTRSKPDTTVISGSSDARSADCMAGGGSAARAEPSSTPRSADRMAGEGGAARAEHRGAAPSTPGSSRRTVFRAPTRSEKFVSIDDFEKLSRKFEALESTTTETGSKLAQVEEEVSKTRGDTKQILAILMKGKKEPEMMLSAPPKRKGIMPQPTEVLTESDSDESEDEIEYVPYGTGDQERFSLVPKWRKKKSSTQVACKGGSAAVSSSSSSSSQRKDLSKAPGCGAMVVASKSRQQSLPLPETLGRSGKERSSSPRAEKLRGTGLIQCTDLKALVASMRRDGYTEVPVIVEKTKVMSIHFEMVIANAYDLGDNEAQMLAMLFADSCRSARLIPDACQICEEVIDCFSCRNVGMFMQFFARMAENYHSNPKNGVVISGQLYSYVVLGTDVQICTSFLKYLRNN